MFHTEFNRHPKHQLVPCSAAFNKVKLQHFSLVHSQAKQQAKAALPPHVSPPLVCSLQCSPSHSAAQTAGMLWSEQDLWGKLSKGLGVGLRWPRSPKSVFLVFFLITREAIFNPVSVRARFKAQTWKKMGSSASPVSLFVFCEVLLSPLIKHARFFN